MRDPRWRDLLPQLPETCVDDVLQWTSQAAVPGALVSGLCVFTDGSAELVKAGLGKICSTAGWSAVVFAVVPDAGGAQMVFVGAVWGPVVCDKGAAGNLGATRPTAPVAEVSAIAAFFADLQGG